MHIFYIQKKKLHTMVMILRSHTFKKQSAVLLTGLVMSVSFYSSAALSQEPAASGSPSLIITSGPLPESLRENVYSKPLEVREIEAKDIIDRNYYDGSNTIVSAKINELTSSLGGVQRNVTSLSGRLKDLQRANEQRSADYYANIATINTQLQNGTTPGNPRLISRLNTAEGHLEQLGASVSALNALAVDASNAATEASFLLDSTRAAYGIAGAVEEDHVQLAEVEDSINNTIIVIERVLSSVNDDITRMSAYLASERSNIRTLALGVTNGDLFGKSIANRPFSNVGAYEQASFTPDNSYAGAAPAAVGGAASLPAPRLLAKIKFDRPDVDYEQAVFIAVNEALERYPNARFDLVAVNPTSGNAAEVAIETTKARRNAEQVLRTLTQMGLSADQIDLSYNASPQANASEVHLFVK